jgi:lysophospholipase L1-like esterase
MLWAVGDSITYGFYDQTVPNPLVDGYAARVAATLGLPISNTAASGATLLGGPGVGQASILAQMLALVPPNRYDVVLTMLGTNDMIAYGTDASKLASFSAGLRQGLLWLTSKRRVPDHAPAPRFGQPPSSPDGPAVFVGNTLAQSPYQGSASEAARAAYSAQIAADAAYVNGFGRRVVVVDANASFDPTTQAPVDGLHPSSSGHISIAAAYLAAIRSHL